MRLVQHDPPALNLALNEITITCPYCRVAYKFTRAENGIYSHTCPDTGDRVFFLNGHAWSGIIAYIRTERPPSR